MSNVRSHDLALMRRVTLKDGAAMAEIWRRHGRHMLRQAYGMLRNMDDAEDVAQEAMLYLWRHPEVYRGQCALSAWVYTVVRSKALMLIRARRSRPEIAPVQLDDVAPFLPLPATQERDIDANRLLLATRDAINRLPRHARDLMRARLLLERENPEIARQYGITVPAVKSRVNRVRPMFNRRTRHIREAVNG